VFCAAGGLWAAFGTRPAADADHVVQARRALLAVGSGLGVLAMLLALALFYLWFESVPKWLNEGETAQAKWVLIPVVVFLAGAGLTFAAVQPARAEERSNQNLRRLVYAVNLGLTAFLLFAVLLIGNVFASLRIPNRLDTTESGFYTLDPKTQEYVAKLDTPVNAYATLPEGDRVTDDARRLLLAAQEVNPGRFKVRFLSLTANKDEITRLKNKYPQADLNSFGILLTAGENEQRSAFIRADDLLKTEGGGFGAPQKVTFTGESAVVRELLFLTDPGGKPVIYFTQGSGELEVVPSMGPGGPKRSGRTANQLRSVLEKGYAEVKAWEPELTNPKVPDDCNVLVVADPRFALGKDQADAIRKYMTETRKDGKKGKLILLAGANPKLEGGGIADTGLEEVLAGLTIRLGNKLIIGRPTREGLNWDEHICIVNPQLAETNSVAQAYQEKGLILTKLRTVEPAGPPGMGGPINVEPFLFTYPQRFTVLESEMPTDPATAWNDMVEKPQLRTAKQFTNSPRIVAVVATESSMKRDEPPTNRAVVIGCGEFFADPAGRGRASTVPAEFFANVVSWLRDRPAAAAVANKTYGEYVPSKSADTFRLYFLPVGLTVLAVVALGAGVWVVRRK
jgi:hypothetical protein